MVASLHEEANTNNSGTSCGNNNNTDTKSETSSTFDEDGSDELNSSSTSSIGCPTPTLSYSSLSNNNNDKKIPDHPEDVIIGGATVVETKVEVCTTSTTSTDNTTTVNTDNADDGVDNVASHALMSITPLVEPASTVSINDSQKVGMLEIDAEIEQKKRPINEDNLKKPKKTKGSSLLNKLLEDADWYVTFPAETKPRRSSIKIQEVKLKKSQNQEDEEKNRELTAEELEKRELEKQKRREIQKQKALEKEELQRQNKEKFRLRRLKIEEQKRNGTYTPKSRKNGTDYYSGSEVNKLLLATQYFTNIGLKDKTFDNEKRREIKQVERYSPEDSARQSTKHGNSRRMKTLKRKSEAEKQLKLKLQLEKKKKLNALKKKKLTAKKARGTKKKNKNKKTNEKEKPELEQEEQEEQENSPEEPEPIWFCDVENDSETKIPDNRKMFVDYILDNENNSEPQPVERNEVISAYDLVNSRLSNYMLDDPKFPVTEIELHFPFSNYTERYLLALRKHDTEFNPFDEIGRNMELIALSFMPDQHRAKVINFESPTECIIGRYVNAFENENFEELVSAITEFNNLIDSLKATKELIKFTKEKKSVSSILIYEVLNQCYLRTVIPDARKLKGYKAFSNYVYGELMPSFLTMVYNQTGLTNEMTFIDLGSGVGNCTVQAALEFGCKSYGVEIMEHASKLCSLQSDEFIKRCLIFGLKPASFEFFLNTSFLNNDVIKKVIDESKVILVNNYLFDGELSKKVNELFSDLQTGTKIISLKPIVPVGYNISWGGPAILNRIKTSRFTYGENSVSWTSNGGVYYISEVTPVIVESNLVMFQSRSRRQDLIDAGGDSSRSGSSTPLNAFTNNV